MVFFSFHVVYKKYKARRAEGLVVDGEFLKQTMLFELKKAGKNKDGDFKASCKWLSGFAKRWGVSKQKKTNKKSRSLEERMPQIRNFHWYTIYQMAKEDP